MYAVCCTTIDRRRRAKLSVCSCAFRRPFYFFLAREGGRVREGLRGPVLGVWLPAPLPTPRALPDHGALWPLAVGVQKDLGGIDVRPCGIVCCSLCGLTHPPSIQTFPSVSFHRCRCVSVKCVERVLSVLEARVNVCRGESLRRLEFSFSVTYTQKEKPLDLSHY